MTVSYNKNPANATRKPGFSPNKKGVLEKEMKRFGKGSGTQGRIPNRNTLTALNPKDMETFGTTIIPSISHLVKWNEKNELRMS